MTGEPLAARALARGIAVGFAGVRERLVDEGAEMMLDDAVVVERGWSVPSSKAPTASRASRRSWRSDQLYCGVREPA